jgi:hypothetical protein
MAKPDSKVAPSGAAGASGRYFPPSLLFGEAVMGMPAMRKIVPGYVAMTLLVGIAAAASGRLDPMCRMDTDPCLFQPLPSGIDWKPGRMSDHRPTDCRLSGQLPSLLLREAGRRQPAIKCSSWFSPTTGILRNPVGKGGLLRWIFPASF